MRAPRHDDVVVTGLGIACPLGTGVDVALAALRAGRSAVGPIRTFDASGFPWPNGAEVTDFDPRRQLPDRKAVKLMSRNARLAVAAAGEALHQAGRGSPSTATGDGDSFGLFAACGYEVPEMDDVVGMMAGSRAAEPPPDAPAPGSGRLPLSLERLFTYGRHQMNPIDALKVLPNMALAHVAIAYGVKGPNASFGPWGAAALSSVAEAAKAIRRGACDAALAGGTDSQVNPFDLSYLGTRGLLSRSGSCRPFGPDRDGTVPGEAAAFLVLERRGRAEARGARVLARVAGWGAGSACAGPSPRWGAVGAPGGYLRAGGAALESAGWESPDLLVADGWGTVSGDAAEEHAAGVLGLATGPRAFTKHLLGHCGGAAGVLDLVLALAGRGGSPRRALAWAADPSGAAAAVAVEEEA